MSSRLRRRILAIAPGTRHLGIAVLEGPELVRFGVKTFAGRKTAPGLRRAVEAHLDELHDRHEPDVLAIEEIYYAQARRSPLLRMLIEVAQSWGKRKGLTVVRYMPTTVKRQLCETKPTRDRLADAMVHRYWFLASYRRPGRTRHYWQQMFDAVGLGVAAMAREFRVPPARFGLPDPVCENKAAGAV